MSPSMSLILRAYARGVLCLRQVPREGLMYGPGVTAYRRVGQKWVVGR